MDNISEVFLSMFAKANGLDEESFGKLLDIEINKIVKDKEIEARIELDLKKEGRHDILESILGRNNK